MDSDEGWVRRREKTLITADVIVIVLQEGMKRAQVDGERRDSRGSERASERENNISPHSPLGDFPRERGRVVARRGFACG